MRDQGCYPVRYVTLIEGVSPPNERKRDAAIATLSTLVGAIILSRAVRDGHPGLSDEICEPLASIANIKAREHKHYGAPKRRD